MDRVPPSAGRFVIQRRSDIAPHDVILLARDATPHDLSEALHAILAVRQVGGDIPTTSGTMRVRPQQPGRAHIEVAWTPRAMAELRSRRPRAVAGVGTVPALEVWLPPAHASRRDQTR